MFRVPLLILSLACAAPAMAQDAVDYAKQIKPLLKDRCFTCHERPQAKSGAAT